MSGPISRREFVAATAGAVVASRLAAEGADAALLPGAPTLAAAMDLIVPAQGKMPAASAASCVAYLRRASATDSTLRSGLHEAAKALGEDFARRPIEDQVASLTALERTAPATFAMLRDAVYEAYYCNPAIWALIGYRFRHGRRRTASLERFDEGQLERARRMTPLYREA